MDSKYPEEKRFSMHRLHIACCQLDRLLCTASKNQWMERHHLVRRWYNDGAKSLFALDSANALPARRFSVCSSNLHSAVSEKSTYGCLCDMGPHDGKHLAGTQSIELVSLYPWKYGNGHANL